jgi:hypothetical protein
VVYLADILIGEVNRGYEAATDAVIQSVDGQPVRSLAHLASLVEEGESPFVTFACGNGRRITLDREAALRATPDLLERYGISADRSPNLASKARTVAAPRPPHGTLARTPTAPSGEAPHVH